MKTHFIYAFFSLFILLMSHTVHSATEQGTSELSDNIRRAIITEAIENREPVNDLTNTNVSTNIKKLYLFTEVIGKANSMVTHRWFLNGKLEAEVVLKVGSNRWRTYSSKSLYSPNHLGNWQVEVVDEQNTPIASVTFGYNE